jgi:hypothetical protein
LATFEAWSPERDSIRRLVARLLGEGGGLVEDVGRLLGAEARVRLVDLRKAGVLIAAGSGTILLGLAVASGGAVAALALVLPVWAAALVVAAVELALASALVHAGVARLRRAATSPERTLDVIEDGVRALRAAAGVTILAPSRGTDAASHRVGQPPA